MPSLVLVLVALLHPAAPDSARLVGSTIVVESIGLQIALPPVWFGAKDTVKGLPNCGHDLRGSVDRRFATSRPMLDSVRNARGEWDHEYSAVTDSVLPFANLVAQVGPEPFGAGQCFGDLQMRVYVLPDAWKLSGQALATGLRVARSFFPSATLVGRDSAQWHIDRLRWDAWYYDYGGEANLEIFTTIVRGRTVALVFMRSGSDIAVSGVLSGSISSENNPAERDERFILEHIRLASVPASVPATVPASIPVASVPDPRASGPLSELESQQSSWNRLGLRDYSFTYTQMCMCRDYGLLYEIEVRDGKVVSLWSRDLPRPTVDSLFAWIKNAYVRKAAVVQATYDPQLHFPAKVSIDWNLNMIDDEFSFEVRDLRPIAHGSQPRR